MQSCLNHGSYHPASFIYFFTFLEKKQKLRLLSSVFLLSHFILVLHLFHFNSEKVTATI